MSGRPIIPSLSDADLARRISKREASERLEAAQTRMLQLRLQLGGKLGNGELGPPVCFVFEGWDASGKGGAIKRLVSPMDPRHVNVITIAAPSDVELRHHWLQRFWPHLPGWGDVLVLDRSWYGRVLVERVEGYAGVEQWRRAYTEIVDFERTLVSEGTIFAKFWMHVSPEEQLERFEARRADPLRQWKLTDEDWRNREKRAQYEVAVEEMLARTSWDQAPWFVIPGESKKLARVEVLETATAVVEAGMREHGMKPAPEL